MSWGIFKRDPDFVISRDDGPYMRRWYVLPRNRWFNIYLHNAVQDDDPRALHDHPWWNISIVLKGGYWEIMPPYRPLYPEYSLQLYHAPHLVHKWRPAGSIIMRRATSAHRLALGRFPSWSLFITGPVRRKWGFWCEQGWVPFDEYVRKTADGNDIGAGCGP